MGQGPLSTTFQRLRSREVSIPAYSLHCAPPGIGANATYQRGVALENWEVQRGGAVQSVKFYTARCSETCEGRSNSSIAKCTST